MELKYIEINDICTNNFVQYDNNIYSIYDMDSVLVYLTNPELPNIGVPMSKLRPIILSDNVMNVCGFNMICEPHIVYVGNDIVKTKTSYTFKPKHNKTNVDFKVTLVRDYDKDNDPFLVKALDQIDKTDTNIKYLHQVQNIYRMTYNNELLKLG